jgi:hypothetical protein
MYDQDDALSTAIEDNDVLESSVTNMTLRIQDLAREIEDMRTIIKEVIGLSYQDIKDFGIDQITAEMILDFIKEKFIDLETL